MNKYKAKFFDVIKSKAGQILIHEDTDTVVVELRAGNGWFIGKPRVPRKGLNMNRNLQIQLIFSREQWERDMYYIGEREAIKGGKNR